MKFYSKKLDKLYEKLIDEFVDKIENNKEYCLIYPSAPKNYKKTGLMICGRATNGWIQPWTVEDAKKDKQKIISEAKSIAPNAWTVDDFNSFSRKPLFRITKRILTEYHGIIDKDFPSYFIWTNLMKIAPNSSRNPSNSEFYAQIDVCKQIFKYEIDTLEPKNVVLFAGAIKVNNWAYDFIEHLGLKPRKSESKRDIVAVYDYMNTRIIHTVRPEIKAFGNTDEHIFKQIIKNMK